MASTATKRGLNMGDREYWAAYHAERVRLDRRNCTTGYSCGASCIPVKKECRKQGGLSSIGKERLKKIQAIASGEQAEGLGLGRLKQGEASELAGQVQQRRSNRAKDLRESRSPLAAIEKQYGSLSPEKIREEIDRIKKEAEGMSDLERVLLGNAVEERIKQMEAYLQSRIKPNNGQPTAAQQQQLTAMGQGVSAPKGRAQRGREVEAQLKSTLAGMAASDRDLFRNAGRAISEMQAGVSRLAELEGVELDPPGPTPSKIAGSAGSRTPRKEPQTTLERGRAAEEALRTGAAGLAASDRDLFRGAGRAISEIQGGISRLAEMEGIDLSDVQPTGSGRVTSSTPQAIEGGGKTREQVRREKGLDLAQGEQRGLDLGLFGSGSTPLFGSEAFVPGAGQQPAPKPDEVEYKRFTPKAGRIPKEPKLKTSPNAKPLPKGVTDQVKAVSSALREAKTPLTAQEVKALFKGKTAIVPDILNALTVAGGLQVDDQGRYFYPVYSNNIVGR